MLTSWALVTLLGAMLTVTATVQVSFTALFRHVRIWQRQCRPGQVRVHKEHTKAPATSPVNTEITSAHTLNLHLTFIYAFYTIHSFEVFNGENTSSRAHSSVTTIPQTLTPHLPPLPFTPHRPPLPFTPHRPHLPFLPHLMVVFEQDGRRGSPL